MLTPPLHKLVGREAQFPVHGRPQSSGNLRHVFIPAVLCLLIDIAAQSVHEVRLYLSTWPLTDCRYGVVHAL